MINAEIYYDPNNQTELKGFLIKGHAGMAERGQDIVCASVSVLAQTALLGLAEFLSSKPNWKILDSGYMECWLPEELMAAEQKTAQIILQTMLLGLLSIEKDYGQYLKVIKRRWIQCCSE